MSVILPGRQGEGRWDRQRRIAWMDMGRISSASALVLGAGALGNEAVKNLALAGVRRITLVDMDRAERSNLSRCALLRDSDSETGRFKAEAVAARAAEMDPGCRVAPVCGRVEDLPDGEWGRHDIVLGCLDNIQARLHANAHACHAGVPYIDGGTDGMSGRVQVVMPGGPCFQCGLNRSHYKVLERRFSCTGAGVVFHEPPRAAEITTTSIIAAIQVREAMKILSGRAAIRHAVYYDGLAGRLDELELDVDPECPLHQRG